MTDYKVVVVDRHRYVVFINGMTEWADHDYILEKAYEAIDYGEYSEYDVDYDYSEIEVVK